ncbi:MAG: DNA translocase FtsK, partial [Anaerolineaceae bacterium]
MAARTRTRPRATRAPRTNRKRRSRFSAAPLKRPELLAVGAGAILVAASLLLFDVPEVAADIRDSLLRQFGLGVAVLAGWAAFLIFAAVHRSHNEPRWLARRAAGFFALGLFAWGTLGLNRAEWTLGAVDFQKTTLGGDVGGALISGFLGKLAWLSLLVVAMALLAPGPTRWLARNGPHWVELSWERRYWHRAASGFGRFIAFAFRRPSQEDGSELLIGATGFERIEPMGRLALEDGPVVYRPSIDPGSPSSPVGAGAAAHFGSAIIEAPPGPAHESPATSPPMEAAAADFGEPQQLGLALDSQSGWHLPALEMLNAPLPSASRKHDNAARAQMIVDTLASFGVDASVVEINEGPTVTQFGVEPGWEVRYKDLQVKDENGRAIIGGDNRPQTEKIETSRTRVRVNRITALQNDLALALAAPSLRIEAPVPGRAIVGIEVPNDSATVVTMRTVMETK